MIRDLALRIWMRLQGNLQWRILWLFNSKFNVSVAGVVRDDHGRVLLLRHRYWVPEVWGLPGGIVKTGELLEEALSREVLEETGYGITDVKLLEVVSGYRLRLEVYYRATLIGGTLSLQKSEILEARWFEIGSLPTDMMPLQRRAVGLTVG